MEHKESNPSSSPSPKWDIPDTWAKNGRCPACGAANLKVTHLPDFADYLACVRCEVSFEVENGGRYIRLKYIPDEYEFIDALVHNRWVEASRLSGIIAERRPVSQIKKVAPVAKQVISEDDAWRRAVSMYRLGNKPRMIQLTLMQTGMSQEQADVIFEKLKKLAEQDARQQNQKFLIMAGVSLFLIVTLAGGWLFMSGNLSMMLGITTPTPVQFVNQPSAVDKLLSLVPSDAKPALMNLPDTVAYTGRGPGKSACPANPSGAAKLFGGSSDIWKRDGEFPSWQMVNPGTSVTVLVPSNMVAGYVDNKSFQFLSVHGPATIYNANFVAINCE